jgi:hypothetical protein
MRLFPATMPPEVAALTAVRFDVCSAARGRRSIEPAPPHATRACPLPDADQGFAIGQV